MPRRASTAWIASASLLALIGCGRTAGAEAPVCEVVDEEPLPVLPVQGFPPTPVHGRWSGTFTTREGSVHAVDLTVGRTDMYAFPWAIQPGWVTPEVYGTIDGWFDIYGFFLVCRGKGNRPCYSAPYDMEKKAVRQGDVRIFADALEEHCAVWHPTTHFIWPVVVDLTLDRETMTLRGDGLVGLGCHHLLPDDPWGLEGHFDLQYFGPDEE